MAWKRYWIFLLLFVGNMALIAGIDGMHGTGINHIVQTLAFTFRMMDSFERTILLVLIIILIRKPIGRVLMTIFGGKGGKGGGGGTSGGSRRSSGAVTQASPQQPDQQ